MPIRRALSGTFLEASPLLILLFLLHSSAFAQDRSSFVFEATSPQPYTPAYLGNGVISLVSSPLGIEPSESFLAGVYDHSNGDVPRIAAAPNWNEFAIFNGAAWLHAGTSVDSYHQTLNMYDGVLQTAYVWNNHGKSVQVRVEQFVARDNPTLAGASLTIIPNFSGPIRVRLPLRNWAPPHRYPLAQLKTLEGEARTNQWAIWYPGHLDAKDFNATRSSPRALLSLTAIAPGTGVVTGEAIAMQWTGAPKCAVHQDSESAEADLTVEAHAGRTYTFTKFAAITIGEDDARRRAVTAAESARASGWQTLLKASAEKWHRLWDTDILVEGDPALQRTIHSMLFYLLASTREDLDISTPPMGLSSAGYYGHIFWDADTFMFPPLLILHPELARPMVAFRSRTLAVARENAKSNHYAGAMYPWEAGPDGAESTPRFAAQNASSENHVNGDVAVASWQYWAATGDATWLERDCWPILRDTADFWSSRVTYDAKRQHYIIGNVVAVNESEIGVSNDPYTNAVAKRNLELAVSTARALKEKTNPKWQDVAARMYLPDSDSALLWFPLSRPFPEQQTRHAVQAMMQRVKEGHSGAMMGTEFYPILAAQIGDRPTIRTLLDALSGPYLRPPFNAIAETPRNQNISFITGAGAFLQQFVFGYTGLRLTANGLEQQFSPVLPPGISRLTLKNITVRGKRETLTVPPSR